MPVSTEQRRHGYNDDTLGLMDDIRGGSSEDENDSKDDHHSEIIPLDIPKVPHCKQIST